MILQHTGENRPREVSHLFVLQANVLQPADDPGVLLRQHDADQQHNQAQTHDAAAGEPFGIEQGLLRLCSKVIAATISITAAASAQPIHGASNHHSSRPSDSTAHTSAMPGASRKKVMKSFFEHFLRSLGGSFSAMTQASDTSAEPSSKK